MTIKEIRQLSGLSQAKFAEKYGIPKRTIEAWESHNEKIRRVCPSYVNELLERAVKDDFNIS